MYPTRHEEIKTLRNCIKRLGELRRIIGRYPEAADILNEIEIDIRQITTPSATIDEQTYMYEDDDQKAARLYEMTKEFWDQAKLGANREAAFDLLVAAKRAAQTTSDNARLTVQR